MESIDQRKVSSLYGVPLDVLLLLWNILLAISIAELPVEFHHLLWALHFMKNYPTEDVGSAFWNVDRKTYRKYVWRVIILLYLYLDTVSISHDSRDDDNK